MLVKMVLLEIQSQIWKLWRRLPRLINKSCHFLFIDVYDDMLRKNWKNELTIVSNLCNVKLYS
jgi:hypothetical protein